MYAVPSSTTNKSYSNSYHNIRMKCFACSAVTYSSNREKKRSPSSVIAPSRHVQSRCPDSSTEGRVPRGNHAARGSNCTNSLVWSIQTTVASISRRFFFAHRETPLSRPHQLRQLNGVVSDSLTLFLLATAGYSGVSPQRRTFRRETAERAPASTPARQFRLCWWAVNGFFELFLL